MTSTRCGLLAWLLSFAASQTLQRVRLRSGEYPAATAAEEGTWESQGAGPGGLGGSPMPTGCVPELHRPMPPEDEGLEHPLQHPLTVLALSGPVELAVFEWRHDSQRGSNPHGWQLSSRRQTYVPDHRRYSRGGSLWALSWLLSRGQSSDTLVPEGEDSWAARVLRAISAMHAIADDSDPTDALLVAESPWALDASEWLAARNSNWQEGLYLALALLGEQLCRHWSSRAGEDHLACTSAEHLKELEQLQSGEVCNVAASLAILEESLTQDFDGPVLSLANQLLDSCNLREAAGAAAWSAFWRRLAVWLPQGQLEEAGECPAEALTLASPHRTILELRLCMGRTVSVAPRNGPVEVHVLGVSAALGGARSCVLLEAVLHIASRDGCYVTQAGSNLRTLPISFLGGWRCAVSSSRHAESATIFARGSAASAFGTDTVVRCAFKLEVLQDAAAAGALFLHLSSAKDMHVEGIPLCGIGNPPSASLLEPVVEPPRQLTVCTGVMFNADQQLPGALPGTPTLLEQWLAYHEEVGVDHFALYDSDGSAAAAAQRGERVGKVSYFPHWPSQLSAKLGEISRTQHCRHCLSALAEAHCVWSNRGLSSWVVTLHSFDAYLAPAQGWGTPAAPPGVGLAVPLNLLAPIREEVGTVAVPMMDFGGRPRNSSWLLERFCFRAVQPVQVLAEIGRGNPRDDCWLNHPGVTLRNPANIWGVYDHYARSQPGTTDVEAPFELLRVNHYVDIFGERCSSRFLHCEVPDAGLLWALPGMRGRLGAS